MSTSIEPERFEIDTPPVVQAAAPGALVAMQQERAIDLYAENELRRRHERTERAIQKAIEQQL